jgi:hypothetical protein
MRLYHGGGFDQFRVEAFSEYMISDGLKIEIGQIKSASILERKFLSNRGNALSGTIQCENSAHVLGLNIGGNPIGTGYRNYIPFLKEMGCKRKGHIFIVNSLVGILVPYVVCGDTLRGYLTPRGLLELNGVK